MLESGLTCQSNKGPYKLTAEYLLNEWQQKGKCTKGNRKKLGSNSLYSVVQSRGG